MNAVRSEPVSMIRQFHDEVNRLFVNIPKTPAPQVRRTEIQ